MKNFIRKIFRINAFEKILVFLLQIFPGSSLLKGLTSQNKYYAENSIRNCKRYGIKYSLDISDYQNWLLYFYSKADSSFNILKYLKKDFIVLDVGGNIGQTAMMIAKELGDKGHVYSFEPYPATVDRFKKNLSLNPFLSKRVQIENCALGSSPGKVNMYRDCATNSGANRVIHQQVLTTDGYVEVPVSTVDLFVKSNPFKRINLLKIDVEGFEMEVLRGAHRTLTEFKPHLFIELDDNNLKKQRSNAGEVCQFLESLGYKIYEENKIEVFSLAKASLPVNIYCTIPHTEQ
jgi:FkbM family methyltransferase